MVDRKRQDLIRFICKIENISPDEALFKLQNQAFETDNLIKDDSDILELYLKYSEEIKKDMDDTQFRVILKGKCKRIIKRLSSFYNCDKEEIEKAFKNSNIYKLLMHRNTNYWLKPDRNIVNIYLMKHGFIFKDIEDQIFFASDYDIFSDMDYNKENEKVIKKGTKK